jgi:hypothetical protein
MSNQGQLPPLTIAALVRLAVISIIVFCIVASFAYAAGRHLTGQADKTTVREPIPTDLGHPSEQQPQPRGELHPLARSDLRGW